LQRSLIAYCPDADLLADDPDIAERITTYPEDHVAADVVMAARALVVALDYLLDD
jgi:hypothetical protein